MAKDDCIYIAVEENWMLKELYMRKADCKNDAVNFKPFILPQFHAKFMALGRICAERRSEDSDLRTQMRFNTRDIEILIKYKASGEGLHNC